MHDQHEYLHASLREKYGEEAALDFEKVIRDLDVLGNELHNVSEHAVKLDTNFEKYGYSAHLSESRLSLSLFYFYFWSFAAFGGDTPF